MSTASPHGRLTDIRDGKPAKLKFKAIRTANDARRHAFYVDDPDASIQIVCECRKVRSRPTRRRSPNGQFRNLYDNPGIKEAGDKVTQGAVGSVVNRAICGVR